MARAVRVFTAPLLVASLGFWAGCSASSESGGPVPADEGTGGGGPIFGADAGLRGNDGGRACIRLDVGFERLTPTVIVLVDRSGSMLDSFDGPRDRWNTLRDVLIGPTGILRRVQDRVRLGLTTYTSSDGNRGGACPLLVSVPPALNNLGPIEQMYRAAEIADQEDDTPTPEAFAATTQQLQAFAEPGPKVIVLATDGEPDTCADPDAHNGDTNRLAVTAVQNAYRAGIRTEVLSVGSDVGQQHLQDLANAGNGGTGGTAYRALDAQSLIDAFDAIIGGVVSCEFTLAGQVQAGKEPQGKVRLGSRDLAYQSPDGWILTAPNRLLLQGAACTEAKRAEAPLHIEFPCDTFSPIE